MHHRTVGICITLVNKRSPCPDCSAHRGHIDPTPGNQGLNKPGHRSYSLCNQHLHDQIIQYSLSTQPTTLLEVTPKHEGHIFTFLLWLTKDCINGEIDHTASSTISSYVYKLTIQLHLLSVPRTETILIFETLCRKQLIDFLQHQFPTPSRLHRRDTSPALLHPYTYRVRFAQ